jgi:hypothetical protein
LQAQNREFFSSIVVLSHLPGLSPTKLAGIRTLHTKPSPVYAFGVDLSAPIAKKKG